MGLRAGNNYKRGPQTSITRSSVVDSCSVSIDLKKKVKKIDTVCDCGASVSCLSPHIYDALQQTHKLNLKQCRRKLRAPNGSPIEVKGVVRVPVTIGQKSYEHDSCVLDKSETDCED